MFADYALELQIAIAYVPVNETALFLCFSISSNGNGFLAPVQSLAVCRHIGDMMLRKEVSEALHGGKIIRHDDIDIGFVF